MKSYRLWDVAKNVVGGHCKAERETGRMTGSNQRDSNRISKVR